MVVSLLVLTYLLANMFYLISVKNKQNKFHLDYLIMNLLFNLSALLVYIFTAFYDNHYKWISLSTSLNLISWIFFTLHVESAVKGRKKKISWYYYFYIGMYIIIIVLNNLNIYVLNYITPIKKFLLLKVPKTQFFSDQVALKSIITLLILSSLLIGSIKWLRDSFTIRNKARYLYWVLLYCTLILLGQTLIFNYYFNVYTPFSQEVFLLLLKVICVLILVFFVLNPVIISYLPNIVAIYKRSKTNSAQYYELISVYVVAQNGYLKPRFSINELSNKTKISPRVIRAVIKTKTGKNFTEFINSFRVEKAVALIMNGYLDKFNVKALGIECGFNSHQTFFRAFRKVYGMTPGQFLNQNKFHSPQL